MRSLQQNPFPELARSPRAQAIAVAASQRESVTTLQAAHAITLYLYDNAKDQVMNNPGNPQIAAMLQPAGVLRDRTQRALRDGIAGAVSLEAQNANIQLTAGDRRSIVNAVVRRAEDEAAQQQLMAIGGLLVPVIPVNPQVAPAAPANQMMPSSG